MTSPTVINSPQQFHNLLKSSKYVLADFHATWCGPCHMIAPIYSQLSSQHSSPSNITFTKIDVDAQQQLAREYGVSAMPTFLIFKDGQQVNSIRGANPPALKQAVEGIAAERRNAAAAEEKARKAKEIKNEPNDVSVGGTYGISKGSEWKMSLR